MSIPRLELIALYIAYNLAENIKSPLTNYNIKDIHDWTDSTVILHWLKEEEGFKQFVSNRINKINTKAYITWRHVPSNQNPAEDEEYMETKYKIYGGQDQHGLNNRNNDLHNQTSLQVMNHWKKQNQLKLS